MATKKLNTVITIGGAISASLKSALSGTKTKLTEIGSTIRKLEREQSNLNNAIGTFGRMGKNVDTLRGRYAAVTAEIEKQRRAKERLNAAHGGVESGRARMGAAGMVVGVAAAAATAALFPVIQAASFEKSMLGVAKQVDGARDASGNLTAVYFDMAKRVQELGREIPIATNDIAEMVAAGARMGIARDELIEFTKTAAMMASAFDLPAAELADNMGKIKGLFGLKTQAEVRALADSINYLDDNAISKGADIIEFLTRTGGVASAVKVTGNEMAALGSTLLTMGERTETASTATNAMFSKFAAADKGTKKFKSAMKEIGLSTAVIQKGMQVDAQGTLLKVLEAIHKLNPEKRLGVITELVGLEHSDTIAKLAGNIGEYRKQIALAGSEKAKGSMSREFAAQLATTNAQWEITKNRLTELGVNIGSILLPAINSVLGAVGPVVSKMAEWVRENDVLVGNIIAVVGALTAIKVGAALVSMGVGAVTMAFNVLRVALLTNPIGLALTLLATAAFLIYKNWAPIKDFFMDLWGSVSGYVMAAHEVFKTLLSWNPVALVIQNWEPIKTFFSNLWADITATARQAFDWIIGKITAIGNTWQKTKSFFGMGDGPQSEASAPAGASVPKLPPMAGSRGGASYTDQSQTSIKITQLPGENADQLTERIMRKMDERKGVQRRSMMFDPVTP